MFFGHAGACVAVDGDLGLLVHACGVVADVALDRHLHRRVDADGNVVRAVGMCDDELTGQVRSRAASVLTSRSGPFVGRRSR